MSVMLTMDSGFGGFWPSALGSWLSALGFRLSLVAYGGRASVSSPFQALGLSAVGSRLQTRRLSGSDPLRLANLLWSLGRSDRVRGPRSPDSVRSEDFVWRV